MNLFLRLLIHLLKKPFQPRIGLFDECVTRFRVWFTDQDMFRHATNSRYFSITDVCIIDYMLRTGSWPKLSKRGWIPIVAYEDMIFRKMMRAPQKFVVRTQMLGWTDDYVVLRHLFERRERVVAEGVTIARFVNRKGETIPAPTVAQIMGHDGTSPAMPDYAADALERAARGYRPESAEAGLAAA